VIVVGDVQALDGLGFYRNDTQQEYEQAEMFHKFRALLLDLYGVIRFDSGSRTHPQMLNSRTVAFSRFRRHSSWQTNKSTPTPIIIDRRWGALN
jgi:hypothetical protein